MAGRAYTIFDTAVGRCGIAWGAAGVVGVQLPETREIDTIRRLLRQFPDARAQTRPEGIGRVIAAITAFLRGEPVVLSDIPVDFHGVTPFNRRVYDHTRLIPPGETRTLGEIAARLGASGAAHAVGQAITRNPYAIIVPCHRVFETAGQTSGFSANGGIVSKSRLLSIEGGATHRTLTLMDVLFAVAPVRPQG